MSLYAFYGNRYSLEPMRHIRTFKISEVAWHLLYVKSEMHHIAVFNDVFFSFNAQFSGFFDFGF